MVEQNQVNIRDDAELKQGSTLMKLFQRLAGKFMLLGSMASLLPFVANAATLAEVDRLNAAYPPGSVILCLSELPGDGKDIKPTTLTVRAKVDEREENRAVYHTSITWLAAGSSAGLTLAYRMTLHGDETGQYSKIDPDSMQVTLPGASPETEKIILQGFRERLTADESFVPYSQIEITDFPSYISHNPGQPPSYCHKEQDKNL